jgi:hypothetical protein
VKLIVEVAEGFQAWNGNYAERFLNSLSELWESLSFLSAFPLLDCGSIAHQSHLSFYAQVY